LTRSQPGKGRGETVFGAYSDGGSRGREVTKTQAEDQPIIANKFKKQEQLHDDFA
jgi:hypothetical protein